MNGSDRRQNSHMPTLVAPKNNPEDENPDLAEAISYRQLPRRETLCWNSVFCTFTARMGPGDTYDSLSILFRGKYVYEDAAP